MMSPRSFSVRRAPGEALRADEQGAFHRRHALMENRNGLIVDVLVTQASGTAEREAAVQMLEEHLPGTLPITLAADRG
jgi:hypothetical protein